ncbi:ATP-binding cassette domain-containing protein [Gallintestinimicrobium sp.]|uniref:ATP-binding cassette domain-containing protein n=1 Tax=Gallintestinimicrobium sp. TaxID=2981655 RepID=UPI0039927661
MLVDGKSVKTERRRKENGCCGGTGFLPLSVIGKKNLSMCQNSEKATADYIAALEMVGLETLKDKLDYKIGKYGENSTDLSDGQWQKIALARVLLSDAKMFLLDEPTASMDPIGESKLYEDMMNVMKDRGVIIVTHRLALAKTVDLIAVMRDGGIVGLGSHEELMENNAYYRQLYDAQSEWYR